MPALLNAFHRDFLDLFGGQESPPTAEEALANGPWEVSRLGPERWAVVRPGVSQVQLRPAAIFTERPLALLAAAVLPAPARAPYLRLGPEADDVGYSLHALKAPSGLDELGWLMAFDQGWAAAIECALHLARQPASLAHLLEAVGSDALEVVGALLASRFSAPAPRLKPSPLSPPGRVGANAFTPAALEYLDRDDAPSTAVEAATAGPWQVAQLGPRRHAVVKAEAGGHPLGVFKERSLALLAAATLPAVGRAPLFLLHGQPRLPGEGHPVEELTEHGLVTTGWLASYDPHWLSCLSCAAHLARCPDDLSRLLEGVGGETLERAGALLVQRLQAALNTEGAVPGSSAATEPGAEATTPTAAGGKTGDTPAGKRPPKVPRHLDGPA